MHSTNAAWRARQRKYWTRENAHLWIRHDAERFFRTRADFERACGAAASKADTTHLPAPDADPRALELAWERYYALRREIAELRLDCLRARWLGKYSPDQPRVPAGNPDGGQWTSGGIQSGEPDSDSNQATEFSSAGKAKIVRQYGKWTVRQFVSRYCTGVINRELPSEFENLTIEDIWDIARGGDARARKCLKLLKEPRFRK